MTCSSNYELCSSYFWAKADIFWKKYSDFLPNLVSVPSDDTGLHERNGHHDYVTLICQRFLDPHSLGFEETHAFAFRPLALLLHLLRHWAPATRHDSTAVRHQYRYSLKGTHPPHPCAGLGHHAEQQRPTTQRLEALVGLGTWNLVRWEPESSKFSQFPSLHLYLQTPRTTHVYAHTVAP